MHLLTTRIPDWRALVSVWQRATLYAWRFISTSYRALRGFSAIAELLVHKFANHHRNYERNDVLLYLPSSSSSPPPAAASLHLRVHLLSSKSRPAAHCMVLPLCKFNVMIPAPLAIHFISLSDNSCSCSCCRGNKHQNKYKWGIQYLADCHWRVYIDLYLTLVLVPGCPLVSTGPWHWVVV